MVPLYLQIGRSKLTSPHSATNNKQQERTMQSRVSLFTLITFISCASCAVPFYKYGSGAGDSRLPTGANPSVGLTLPESYTFYGVEYSRIFVSLYGVPVYSYRITGVRQAKLVEIATYSSYLNIEKEWEVEAAKIFYV